MNENSLGVAEEGQVNLPIPPSGGTIKETIEWLEKQNKRETKEQRSALRVKIEKQLFLMLQSYAAIKPDSGNFAQRTTWNLLIQQHVPGIALIAGSPYKSLRAKKEDMDLTPRVDVLEQKIRLLLAAASSLPGISAASIDVAQLANKVEIAFREDRSLRNVILQRSYSITRVNNFILKLDNQELLEQKMTTYYKTIQEIISNMSKAYQESNSSSSVAIANARRHATEWADFAYKYTISALKLKAKKSEDLFLKITHSRYDSDITKHLMSSDSSNAIMATEVASSSSTRRRADFVLKNGVEIDFKALGSQGFQARAALPSNLNAKPFRVLAEIQQMAESEKGLPEMNLSFTGNPPNGLIVSINANSSASVYEAFAEFVVKAFAMIR
jgi:hypothetical protein